MIRFVANDLAADFLKCGSKFGIYYNKIYSLYLTYGTSDGILDLWIALTGSNVTGVFAKFEGTLYLDLLPGADLEETADFLCAAGVSTIEGESAVLAALQIHMGSTLAFGKIMTFVPERAEKLPLYDSIPAVAVERDTPLREIYTLLCRADPTFAGQAKYESWLTEASHKRRHELADLYTLSVNNFNVSTISIYFKGPTQHILAFIATDPDFRGKGYGRRLLDKVCSAYRAGPETLTLFTEAAGIERFYERCGFVVTGSWERRQLKKGETT